MAQPFSIRRDRHLLDHPFYRAWTEGRLLKAALRGYAGQYYPHVEAFPEYLRAALGLCTDPAARAMLAENLAEEDGTAYGTSHPELWLRFAEGVGASREEVLAAPRGPGIRGVVAMFTEASRRSLGAALGALYAYESQVPEVAEAKLDGLRRHFGITDARTLAFFEVHRTADVAHRASLRAMIETLPSAERTHALEAADAASQALWDFLTDIH